MRREADTATSTSGRQVPTRLTMERWLRWRPYRTIIGAAWAFHYLQMVSIGHPSRRWWARHSTLHHVKRPNEPAVRASMVSLWGSERRITL